MSMNQSRNQNRSAVVPILAVLAIVVVMLGAYVGGYFWLGDRTDIAETATIQRRYNSTWLPHVFKPAAIAEYWLTGRNVRLVGHREF